MEGDDGRFYSSEAEWESAYDEGCKAELYAVLRAELSDHEVDEYPAAEGSVTYVRPADDEIPF